MRKKHRQLKKLAARLTKQFYPEVPRHEFVIEVVKHPPNHGRLMKGVYPTGFITIQRPKGHVF